MLFPALEEKLRQAKLALSNATSDNVIDLCRQYLARLAEYRVELFTLPDTPGNNLRPGPSSSAEDVARFRKVVRGAIEVTTRERDRTEALLRSFLTVSGYEAVEIFNRRRYKDSADWELRAGAVGRFSGGVAVEKISMQDAVDTASRFRREEYVARQSESLVSASLTTDARTP